jgi:hypothetical protein
MRLDVRTLVLTLASAAGALWLANAQPAHSYEEQLLRVQVREELGSAAATIEGESPAVQALFLDHTDNQALVLKMQAALLRYPELARRILPIYGEDPDFQDVLLRFGEPVLPVIAYFMDNRLTSLEWRERLGRQVEGVKQAYARWTGQESAAAPASQQRANDQPPELTPEERGRYAIAFLREEGYGFLGQFAVEPDGTAHWVQTERALEDLSSFFLGGVSRLETKWRQGQHVAASDVAWAAVDVAVIAASVKLVKALSLVGREARAAKAVGFSERVTLFGSRLLARGGRIAVSAARLGAVPAAIYLMVRYPSLINATLAELAGWLGVRPWIVQFLGWFLGIWVLGRLAMLLLRPVSALLGGLAWLTARLAGWSRASYLGTRVA